MEKKTTDGRVNVSVLIAKMEIINHPNAESTFQIVNDKSPFKKN